MCTKNFSGLEKKSFRKIERKEKKLLLHFFLFQSNDITIIHLTFFLKQELHAIYRTWQGLFPWALRCLLLSITKIHTCSSRKCIQCTRLKIPFHKFRKTLFIIYLVYLIIQVQVSSIFNGIYTTLLVRLFGYITAVLLAIMNTS